MAVHAYRVVVHRETCVEGTWWVFDIPALGATGQADRFEDVQWEARCIIAAWNDDGTNPAEVTVSIDRGADKPL
ncbi:hypothetical protein [uncultured Corynebacterium sp.]|uniref:hypothetical protein n=1 Tax=uncultured Corynebacterium sp. TaxID=159447 RepID=UPI0025CFCF0D|nr:hypothetical protein [uncultured Corynebacterium sp.]